MAENRLTTEQKTASTRARAQSLLGYRHRSTLRKTIDKSGAETPPMFRPESIICSTACRASRKLSGVTWANGHSTTSLLFCLIQAGVGHSPNKVARVPLLIRLHRPRKRSSDQRPRTVNSENGLCKTMSTGSSEQYCLTDVPCESSRRDGICSEVWVAAPREPGGATNTECQLDAADV